MIFKYTCSECKYTFVTTNTGCEACIMCLARKLSQEKILKELSVLLKMLKMLKQTLKMVF